MNLIDDERGVFGKEAPTDYTDERGTRFYRNEIVQEEESVQLSAIILRQLSTKINPYLARKGFACRIIGSIAANAGVRQGKISDIDLQAYNLATNLPCDPDTIYSILHDDELIRICQSLYNSSKNEVDPPLQKFMQEHNLTMPKPRIEMFGPNREDGTKKGYYLELTNINIKI